MAKIVQTLSGQSSSKKSQTPSAKFDLREIASHFPLSWSHYIKLLAVKHTKARSFYEAEALRGGWSVRQLDSKTNSMFYQRALLSKNQTAFPQ